MRRLPLLAAGCGALLLSGCATAAPKVVGHTPPQWVSAAMLGPTGSPRVSAIDFPGPETGWIGVEEIGAYTGRTAPGTPALLRTTDGGRTWQTLAKVADTIAAIDFVSPRHGFVLTQGTHGLALYGTANGGRSLRLVAQPGGLGTAPELRFTSPSDGFVVSGQGLEVTTDGGRTWRGETMHLPALTPQATPYFVSVTRGFVAEGGAIYRTVDAGATWQQVYRLPAPLLAFGGGSAAGPVTFVSTRLAYAAVTIDDCWAGGCPDVILRSEDGGASWRPVSYAMQGTLPGLAAPGTGPPGGISSLVGWGEDGVAASTMLGLWVSHDGGVSWRPASPQEITSPGTFSVVAAAPGGGALAGGNSFLVRIFPASRPIAELWPQPLPTWQIDMVSQHTGFAVQLQPVLRLLRTSDGGHTWRPLTSPRLPKSTAAPLTLSFADASHGWAVNPYLGPGAGQGEIYVTADGGKGWRTVPRRDLTGAQLLSRAQGLIVTSDAGVPKLQVTSDGGRVYQDRRLPRGFPASGKVSFASWDIGFAAGQTRLWRTADGGRRWKRVALPESLGDRGNIIQITADRSGDLWLILQIGGHSCIDLLARNGNWRVSRLPAAVAMNLFPQSLDAISGREAWLLTQAGVFRTRDGGKTWRNITWPAVP